MPFSDINNTFLDGLEFCSKVYTLFEQIREQENGVSRLRLRDSNIEKKLIEELLPICLYIQSKYRAGRYISVKWIDGSQQFDAEIQQKGGYIKQGCFPDTAYLEVTCVMHPNDYLNRELLDKEGFSFGLDGIKRLETREIVSEPVVHSNFEFVLSFSKLVLKQIDKKISISYPANTTLIIQCSLNTLYTPDEWEMLIANVRKNISDHNFQEIFIFDSVCNYSSSIYGKRPTT